MKMKTIGAIIVLFALIGCPVFANATITTFFGADDGVYPGPWPNSAAADSAYVAAASAFGTVTPITFENLATGFYSPFTAAPGVTVTVSAPNYGPNSSGIVNHPDPLHPVNNGFNTTPGGSNWFGFPGGSATFSFTTPQHFFGMYLTGLQSLATASVDLNFNDGAAQVLQIGPTANGGAEFFGFTDTSAFSSITITDIAIDGFTDLWGIDDVNAVPLPPAVWLFGSGLLGMVGWRRFKKS
ncbi:MAG: PEP-CTERM sorting domain-containing protein [Desulfobaccales bacterium]